MDLKDYVDKIKFQLTGGVIECEINDKGLEKIVLMAMEEMNRYYNVTDLIQVKASSCIDLMEYPEIESILSVHRIAGAGNGDNSIADPAYVSQLQMYNTYSGYYSND